MHFFDDQLCKFMVRVHSRHSRRSASFNSSSHPYFIRFRFCRMILLLIENGKRSPRGSQTENAWLKIFLFVVLGSSFSPVNWSISSWASPMTPKVLSIGNLSSLSSRNRGDLSCSGVVAKTSGSFVSHLCRRTPPRRSNSVICFLISIDPSRESVDGRPSSM